MQDKINQIQRLIKEVQEEAVSRLFFESHDDQLPSNATQHYEVTQSNIIGCCMTASRSIHEVTILLKRQEKLDRIKMNRRKSDKENVNAQTKSV